MVLLGPLAALLIASCGAVPLPKPNETSVTEPPQRDGGQGNSSHPLQDAKPEELKQVVRYFVRFGHTDYNKLAAESKSGSLTRLSSDIKKFQKFAGLKQTGALDNATLAKLKEPRCGVKDNAHPMAKTGRRRRWILQGTRWTTRNLTYSVENAPTSVNDQKYVNNVLEDALNTWSREAFIDFRKVPKEENAHIRIKFAAGYHGDQDPFDGRGGTLAHAFFPIYGGDAHFDDDEPWSINSRLGSNLYVASTHEFGHSLGLSHSDVRSMMSPWYQRPADPSSRNLLTPDDVEAIQTLYDERPPDSPGPPQREQKDPEMAPRRGLGGGRRRGGGWGAGGGGWGVWGRPPRRQPRRRFNPFGFGYITQPESSSDPQLCADARLDAALSIGDDTYVFRGQQYWRLAGKGVASGYPRPITENWAGITGPLDAAVYLKQRRRIYMFKDDRVWQLYLDDKRNVVVVSGFPKLISEVFPGTVKRTVTAAFTWGPDSSLLLVSGGKYWRVGGGGGSGHLSEWPGAPHNVDAATQYRNGKTYLFSGQQYYRVDDSALKIDDKEGKPFPRPTGKYWFDCKGQ